MHKGKSLNQNCIKFTGIQVFSEPHDSRTQDNCIIYEKNFFLNPFSACGIGA